MQDISSYLTNVSAMTYVVVFAAGIATSFTPCIYPLIPIVMGVLGANKERSYLRNFVLSLNYVLGLAITFSVLGLVSAMTGRLFGQIQTSALAHVVVGNIIIFFGLINLGAIKWPAFLSRRKQTRHSGKLPVFFMGMSSGLIAAPCTAAVLAALLTYVATTQNIVFGFSLLFTYALGLGSLLLILGTFTGFLKKLPRSDNWMYVFQRTIGFLMILLGEYFIFRAGFLS